jgi:hypothetical protein
MLHFNRKFRFTLVAVLLCIASVALAGQTTPTGNWSGVLRNDNSKRILVKVGFDSKAAHLHFDEPANCKIDANYIETTTDGSDYTFKPSTNGGQFCKTLYPGNLKATTTATGLTLSMVQGNIQWRADLKPDSP